MKMFDQQRCNSVFNLRCSKNTLGLVLYSKYFNHLLFIIVLSFLVLLAKLLNFYFVGILHFDSIFKCAVSSFVFNPSFPSTNSQKNNK